MASNELGDFLRARRARVRPADVGLPLGAGRRRTPGLRREELAAVAGVSIDYCIRLEQGRETNPGSAVLNALAVALRLTAEERSHLYTLAEHASGRVPGGMHRAEARVRPEVRQLLDTVRPSPAYVLNRISDVLAANPEGLLLFAGLQDWSEPQRNTARYTFLHPAARELFADWPKAAASTAANLRSVLAADPGDPALAALIEELTTESPEFARLWEQHDVQQRRRESKAFRHPQVGEFTLSYEVLHLSQDDQRMTIYQALPGTSDHDAMTLLSLIAEREAPVS